MIENAEAVDQYIANKVAARAQWQVYSAALNVLRHPITASFGEINGPLPFAMMRAEMDIAEAAWNAMQAAIASANAIAADCGEKMLVIPRRPAPRTCGFRHKSVSPNLTKAPLPG